MAEIQELTFTQAVVGLALENKAEHRKYMARLSPETLAAVIGRKGKLVVEGPEGGVFIFKVTAAGILSDDSAVDIRNEVWMTDITFQDIVLGYLDPKVARARDQIYFTGDRSLYDSEEIMKLIYEWMDIRLKPIARRIMQMRAMAEGK